MTSTVQSAAPWPGRHNYEFTADSVLADLYRLTSIALGDRPLMTMASGPGDPLLSLRERFIEGELIHLLITTAVTNRIQLEHMKGPREDANEVSFQPVTHKCGELLPDETSPKRIALTLQEACNKIIHAMNIVAQTDGIPERSPLSKRLDVTLRGEKGKKTWVAHLDLIDYVRASTINFGLI